MHKDYLQILEQDTRAGINKTALNGIKIKTVNCPELRWFERTLFLRGNDFVNDDNWLCYNVCEGESFTNYLRALEEVVESFEVCLR